LAVSFFRVSPRCAAARAAVGAVRVQVEHEVAAQDRESVVRAVVADVPGAVLVDDHVPDLRLLGCGEAQFRGPVGEDRPGALDRVGPGRPVLRQGGG
jgi:hypothetical protein